MFSPSPAERMAANATIRPGRDQPPKKGDGSRPEDRPAFNEAAIRARLLEAGVFEVIDALHASADEAFTALLAAIDRMTGNGGPGRPCSHCGRLTESPVVAGRYHVFCSESCHQHAINIGPDERRNQRYKRRKASGVLI